MLTRTAICLTTQVSSLHNVVVEIGNNMFLNVVTGFSHADQGNSISPALFRGGAFFMSFDLTADRYVRCMSFPHS
jgi:hypothetical protein